MYDCKITEYFEDLETEKAYDGYFYTVAQGITIVILGALCGLRNTRQIWQWAANERVKEFLKEKFQINRIPCYFWLLCLLKLIKPASLNRCFAQWVASMLPEDRQLTVSMDGKTIRSTGKMQRQPSALHIVSAHIGELGLTLAQKTVDDKSNEIPAVQELLEELDLHGCMVVADALNCQKETAKKIVKGGGDYLLSVKDNQPTLKKDIADYIHDKSFRQSMDSKCKTEKNRGRIEMRTAYVTSEINWLESGKGWPKLACIGAIHSEVETKKGKSDEWHYYIGSRNLTAEELLRHARLEWSVESMHWLLDVHFEEDYCRVENRNVQQNLNMARKVALNVIKKYKMEEKSKKPLSNIMFECILDESHILEVIGQN